MEGAERNHRESGKHAEERRRVPGGGGERPEMETGSEGREALRGKRQGECGMRGRGASLNHGSSRARETGAGRQAWAGERRAGIGQGGDGC